MTSSPHDALFKRVFSHPEHAAGELQAILPPQLVAAIDWPSLTTEPGSFIDPALAGQHSDLLFSATARTTGDPLLVYVLFEHQSTPDARMALRLLSYMVSIWEQFAKDTDNLDKPLPLIIPALLAQVPGGWTAATQFRDLFAPGTADLAGPFLPDFAYLVDDLHHTTDRQLRSRPLADFPRLALWLMRDARDGITLLAKLRDWAALFELVGRSPGGRDAIFVLLRYVSIVTDGLQFEQFRDILKMQSPTGESLTMTLAEQFRSEGRAEGHAERNEAAIRMVLAVLHTRGLFVSPQARERISATTDLTTLEDWVVRAVTASCVDDLFSE